METNSAEGNDIRDPRFSPDGKSVIFDRCASEYRDICRIHLFSLESGVLGYFLPPPGQTWKQAHFSDRGDKLVFVTRPTGDSAQMQSQARDIYPKTQIAVMNRDGTGLRIVTNIIGYKGMPAFSRSGKGVIFVQAGRIRESGRTVAADFDLWGLDLETGTVGLFAGPFKFYQLGLSTYFPDDQRVLLNGDTPLGQIGAAGGLAPSTDEYVRRYNRSEAFVVRRGQTLLDPPLFTDLALATYPVLDENGSLFFIADGGPKEGLRIRRQRPNGQRDSWAYPPKSSTTWSAHVSRNGRHFLIAVTPEGAPQKVRKLMLLDTTTGAWNDIVLPSETKQINQ